MLMVQSKTLLKIVFCLFIIGLHIPKVSLAQMRFNPTGGPLPLWEAGVGIVHAVAPDYPGADHSSNYTIPFPTALYRGDILRADEDGGMRGRFIKTKNYEVNLSLGGALPANSKDNLARRGMPDLDTMVEFGPGFIYHFINSKKHKLKLNIPIRFAISTDLSRIDDRGLVFNPLLFYIQNGFLSKNMLLFTAISTRFASRQLHKYFYHVDPAFSTSTRPAYNAKGGYLSTSANIGLGFTFKKDYMTFIGIRNSFLQGNVNEESPLLVRRNNTSIALGFIWWAWESNIKGYQ